MFDRIFHKMEKLILVWNALILDYVKLAMQNVLFLTDIAAV
jgi:hypothetical protein